MKIGILTDLQLYAQLTGYLSDWFQIEDILRSQEGENVMVVRDTWHEDSASMGRAYGEESACAHIPRREKRNSRVKPS